MQPWTEALLKRLFIGSVHGGWVSSFEITIKDRQQEARPILLGQQYIWGYQIPIRITHMF